MRTVPVFLVGVKGKLCLALVGVDADGAGVIFKVSILTSVPSPRFSVTFFGGAEPPGTNVDEFAFSRGKADEGVGGGDDMLPMLLEGAWDIGGGWGTGLAACGMVGVPGPCRGGGCVRGDMGTPVPCGPDGG